MNIKKIGLSALAGSLAVVSANAVELSVAGKTEVTYVSKETGTVGNPFGMGNSITFSGSGDVNGMTATYTAVLGDGAQANSNTSETFASSSLMLDMGDMGTVGFDQGVGEFGVSTIDDKMPYAYEEIWTYVGTSNGLRAAGGTNVLGYKNTVAGYTLSIEMDPGHTNNSTVGGSGDGGATGAGTIDSGYNFALTGAPYEGVTAGVGAGTEEGTDDDLTTKQSSDESYSTAFVTYAMGATTVGYQMAHGSGGSKGTSSNEVEIYGISYQVNENLAVSYNEMDNVYGAGLTSAAAQVVGGDVTETTKGFGASYTLGSAALRVLASEGKNIGGKQGEKEDHVEVSLMLAF
jgi:outer membrane protein OmpU